LSSLLGDTPIFAMVIAVLSLVLAGGLNFFIDEQNLKG